MMTDVGQLNRLYRDAVLDHSRRPRNFRHIDSPTCRATGHNPLCGDEITMYVDLEDGTVRDVAFEATGCAICLASASILTEMTKNRPIAAVRNMIRQVRAMFAKDSHEPSPGEMAALAGVRAYPSRVRCATLPWQTLEAALLGDRAAVSTE